MSTTSIYIYLCTKYIFIFLSKNGWPVGVSSLLTGCIRNPGPFRTVFYLDISYLPMFFVRPFASSSVAADRGGMELSETLVEVEHSYSKDDFAVASDWSRIYNKNTNYFLILALYFSARRGGEWEMGV